jgi:hypothetical protein
MPELRKPQRGPLSLSNAASSASTIPLVHVGLAARDALYFRDGQQLPRFFLRHNFRIRRSELGYAPVLPAAGHHSGDCSFLSHPIVAQRSL